MTWFRVDDTFTLHPKVIAAGNAAVGLWIRSGCWSAAQLTDGRIPVDIAAMFGTSREAAALANAGLWYRDGDEWVIGDWLEYQPSAAETRTRRAERAEAGRRGGERSGAARREANAKQQLQANSKQQLGESLNPDPTRPDPTPKKDSDDNSKSVRATAESSSSVGPFDEALDHLVAALAARAGKTDHPGWIATVRRNQATEKGDAIRAALAAGATPKEAAEQIAPTRPASPLRGAFNR